MSHSLRLSLLAVCLMLAAAAAASGQEAVAPEKRAAIKKLLEVDGAAGRSQAIFARLLDKFEGPMADSMIAGLKAQGFFKPLSVQEGAELERRIRFYFDDVFDESKRRVAEEVATPENLERLSVPVFNEYLTLNDINALAAFEQTPLGRKLNAIFPEMLADSVVASLEAKGVFKGAPEDMTDRMAQAQKELEAEPAREARRIFAGATPALAKRLTADEIKELNAFRETPFGQKFAEVYPNLQGEIMMRFANLYGRQVGEMLSETYSRKLEEYAAWLSEATRPGAPRGTPPPSHGRLPTPSPAPPYGRPRSF
ncbi:MAG TPA: DUF2059 domain-containing protein [Pyrinomonadaceae bacterium]|nr:DUF2059 domain-containing protein [Pyrinomonadaceae bacterium]